MTEVFISHSLQDKTTAEALRAYLEERGFSCWTAPGNIMPGSDWAGKQNAALSSMKAFVLVYSENCASSAQAARELELAHGREDVTVIPYAIDDTPLSGSFKKYLAGSDIIRADVENGEMKLEELYGRVCAALGVKAEENAPAGKKRIIRPSIAIIGVAVLIFAGVAWGVDPIHKTITEASYRSKDSGDTKIEFLEVFFRGDYSGDTNNDGAPEGIGKYTGTYTNEKGVNKLEYTGSFKNGVFSGEGRLKTVFSDGEIQIYEGGFADGDFKGKGSESYFYVSGDIEKKVTSGIWDGQENIQDAVRTYYYTDGHFKEFRNDYKNDALEGRGTLTLTYPDGEEGNMVFECTWVDGEANGEGVMTYTYTEGDVKEKTFKGTWTNGDLTGNIVQTMDYFNGDKRVYEGEYSDNNWNGRAKLTNTYASGNISKKEFEGVWNDGELSGNVIKTLTYTNGDIRRYEGEYSDSDYNGKGVLIDTFAEGEITESVCEGTWSSGVLTGNAVLTDKYATGKVMVYKGECTNMIINGKGVKTITYPDGDVKEKTYEGIWAYGDLSGDVVQTEKYFDGDVRVYKGKYSGGNWNGAGVLTLTYASGGRKEKITEGVWNDGVLSGKVKQTYNNNDGSTEIYEGEYSDGKRNGEGVLTTIDSRGRKDVFEGTFKNNAFYTGKQTFYDHNGEFIFFITIENGEIISKDIEKGS